LPSPVGHLLAGLTVHAASARNPREWGWPAAVVAGAALAPDLDLVAKALDPAVLHQGVSHSVGFAAAGGVLAWAIAAARRHPDSIRLGLAVAAAWSSHLLLDYLNPDATPPIGLMALWPFDGGFHKSPWPIFLDVRRSLDWESLRHGLLAAAWESCLLGPLLVAVRRLRSRSS
jgi:membrane-bound metal-dependent hydrolase YbcI (DUF457 family)